MRICFSIRKNCLISIMWSAKRRWSTNNLTSQQSFPERNGCHGKGNRYWQSSFKHSGWQWIIHIHTKVSSIHAILWNTYIYVYIKHIKYICHLCDSFWRVSLVHDSLFCLAVRFENRDATWNLQVQPPGQKWTGWWCNNNLENMSSSMGRMTSHILWWKNVWHHQPVNTQNCS